MYSNDPVASQCPHGPSHLVYPVGAVSGGQDCHVLQLLDAVHLREELRQDTVSHVPRTRRAAIDKHSLKSMFTYAQIHHSFENIVHSITRKIMSVSKYKMHGSESIIC